MECTTVKGEINSTDYRQDLTDRSNGLIGKRR